VVDRPEAWPSTAARDTVFTWQVTGSGDLSDLTIMFRDVNDAQPVLAPGGRILADGSLTGGEVHLWTPALTRTAARTGPLLGLVRQPLERRQGSPGR